MKHLIDPTDLTKQEIDEIISLAEFHHSGGEAQARTGAGLVEQGRQFLVRHAALVALAVGDDILREGDDLVGFLFGQVGRVDEVLHGMLTIC